ncbi:hypothetical protein A11S_686 [Micavibrio aeruginosavorus EPB]|uniref:Uncharacterized protein n=1 Tax=Micavibrio aeruginosavorus EPB TaxID=349215 RepID=M4VGC2_9BACT|nr:hypothetical protein A11S_686 [Micavibrio aeruginosavorus EPB]
MATVAQTISMLAQEMTKFTAAQETTLFAQEMETMLFMVTMVTKPSTDGQQEIK